MRREYSKQTRKPSTWIPILIILSLIAMLLFGYFALIHTVDIYNFIGIKCMQNTTAYEFSGTMGTNAKSYCNKTCIEKYNSTAYEAIEPNETSRFHVCHCEINNCSNIIENPAKISFIQNYTQELATPTCNPNWYCNDWSLCKGGTETRTCRDINNCGIMTNKPSETNSCLCTESWACTSYGSCTSSGVQYRTCTDTNYCGTTFNKPTESTYCNIPQPEKSWSFTSYENTEPYFGSYCDKINPYDLSVRQAAADAIRNHPGAYSVDQLFDVYDWVRKNIMYQSVALAGIPYSPSQTLATRSGDCKNQAVLIASMIGAIGGTAKVVANVECEHSYAIVLFGSPDMDMTSFSQAVTNHYGSNTRVTTQKNDKGVWVIFDPAGAIYPGSTLGACYGSKTVYEVTSCLYCVNQYPSNPYTYENQCYSQCPSGTITTNQYACGACTEGYACNNQCLHCDPGYSLHTDCRCYPQ